MRETRRGFLGLAFGLAATAAAGASTQLVTPQDTPVPGTMPTPPPPPPVPHSPKRDRAELRANQESIKKDVAQLSELVGELQKGLNNSDTKEVLSLDVIRKAEEIEKLAKQIRELVRG